MPFRAQSTRPDSSRVRCRPSGMLAPGRGHATRQKAAGALSGRLVRGFRYGVTPRDKVARPTAPAGCAPRSTSHLDAPPLPAPSEPCTSHPTPPRRSQSASATCCGRLPAPTPTPPMVLWWGADGHCSYLRPTECEQQTMLRSAWLFNTPFAIERITAASHESL